jgi:4-diphosphocytidyl-2-C-methyl-D-erythritol kinase
VSAAKGGGAIAVAAPAKLNLGLRVEGLRADGYHLLESVFVPLPELADALVIDVAPAPATRVSLRVEGGPPGLEADARNLAARAAARFLEAAGFAASVAIALEKRIPVGAGIGGGSSDAGAVLRALAGHFPGALSGERLRALALSLGADVPFFLDPRPALVRGIGDEIETLPRFPSLCVLVATPAPGLATREVFAAWDRAHPGVAAQDSAALTPAEPGRSMRALPVWSADLDPSPGRGQTLQARLLADLLENDLEPVAAALRPAVSRIRAEIERAGARAVGMSGSGPTVFGVFDGLDEAQAAAARIPWAPTDRIHVGRTAGSS